MVHRANHQYCNFEENLSYCKYGKIMNELIICVKIDVVKQVI
jgi:hypothetical protein